MGHARAGADIQSSDSSLPHDSSLPTALSDWGSQDVAIATFLMLLWKDMYPAIERSDDVGDEEVREWDTWGRPPGGFVDLGCVSGTTTNSVVKLMLRATDCSFMS